MRIDDPWLSGSFQPRWLMRSIVKRFWVVVRGKLMFRNPFADQEVGASMSTIYGRSSRTTEGGFMCLR